MISNYYTYEFEPFGMNRMARQILLNLWFRKNKNLSHKEKLLFLGLYCRLFSAKSAEPCLFRWHNEWNWPYRLSGYCVTSNLLLAFLLSQNHELKTSLVNLSGIPGRSGMSWPTYSVGLVDLDKAQLQSIYYLLGISSMISPLPLLRDQRTVYDWTKILTGTCP